jgi:hypothetical protein
MRLPASWRVNLRTGPVPSGCCVPILSGSDGTCIARGVPAHIFSIRVTSCAAPPIRRLGYFSAGVTHFSSARSKWSVDLMPEIRFLAAFLRAWRGWVAGVVRFHGHELLR